MEMPRDFTGTVGELPAVASRRTCYFAFAALFRCFVGNFGPSSDFDLTEIDPTGGCPGSPTPQPCAAMAEIKRIASPVRFMFVEAPVPKGRGRTLCAANDHEKNTNKHIF